ncbi:MAG: SCO family protein [Ignavibacteria bacterium]|jgi:protein SCO1/2
MNMLPRNIFITALTFTFLLIHIGCEKKFPLNKNLTSKSYIFFNQDSVKTEFAKVIKGKVAVVGFIYTHCPDICPMTTHNMFLTQQKLFSEGISDVHFIGITFDPNRDYPSVLKKFGKIRGIDFSDWTFLWGDEMNTNKILERFSVRAIQTDSLLIDDELTYTVLHTDRISIVGKDGRLKKNYKGSTVNLEELYNDIIKLIEE